jgi:hypothetical protein
MLGIVAEIGIDLGAARPFRIGRRHREIGEAVEIARRLRAHAGIGFRRRPDAAELGGFLDDDDLTPTRGEDFRGDKAADAGADDANAALRYRLVRKASIGHVILHSLRGRE